MPRLTETIAHKDRLRICHLLARLAQIDGQVAGRERVFIEGLMEAFELPEKTRQAIWSLAMKDTDLRGDIERLRRHGEGERLLGLLGEVAAADGVIDPREAAMIDHVREVIRLRLGAERFPIKLECLSTEPLEARYDLREVLGEGGFAIVYEARRCATGQRVVIKRLKVELNDTLKPEDRAAIEDRFWREVKIISELKSPYSVRLIDAGFDVDAPYMVLDYIEGRTLGSYLRNEGPLSAPLAKRVLRQVLEAIIEAHGRGVVHRDLKPDNIMITGHGRRLNARVLDYGLAGVMDRFRRSRHATITLDGQSVGTPFYMPPEQITQITRKRVETDLYALGLILSEALTARRAIKVKNHFEALHWQMTDAPLVVEPILKKTGFGEVVEIACRKAWQERYRSAKDMLDALDAVDIAAAEATLEPWRERQREQRARRGESQRWGARLTRLAMAAVALLVAVWAWGNALAG